MKKWSKGIALAVMVMLLVSFALAGCGAPKKEEAKPSTPQAEPQVLNINLGEEPPQMDPQKSTDTVSFILLNATLEGLVRLDPKGNVVKGSGLAADWTVSPDGLKYTFKLRDAKWGSGNPITAQDFEFAWKRALDPRTASEYAYQLYYIKGGEALNSIDVKAPDAEAKIKKAMDEVGVKAIDDKTLEVTLEKPTPYFLSLTSFITYLPIEKKFYEQVGDKYGSDADKLSYSGPFRVKEWVHESKIVLEKNPNYWDAKNVKLQQINMAMVKESTTAINMFEAGDLDVVGIPGEFIPVYKQKGTLQTLAQAVTWYIEFNTKNPVFKNQKIRQAFSMAVDRQAFVDNVLKNGSLAATSFTPPTLPGLDGPFQKMVGDQISPKANPDEAKKLLAEGMKELGITKLPKLTFLAGDSDIAKKYSQALQEFWKTNLGVEVALENVAFKVRLQKMTKGDYDFVFAGWGGDYNDPMTFVDMWVTGGGNNNSFWSNKDYDKYVETAKSTADQKVRMEAMKNAELILLKELPIAPLYWPARNFVEKPYVKGIARYPVGADTEFKWAYIEGKTKK